MADLPQADPARVPAALRDRISARSCQVSKSDTACLIWGQIRQVLTDFRTWRDLTEARFPAVEAPPEGSPEAEPWDPRTDREKGRDAVRRLTRERNESDPMFSRGEVLAISWPRRPTGTCPKTTDP